MLNDLARAHAFAQHKELALILVLDVLGQEDDSKIVDSALDLCFGLLEIKQLIDELHVGYGLFGVADDDDLVVFGGEDPFDGGDFVELWNFFFYIYHI